MTDGAQKYDRVRAVLFNDITQAPLASDEYFRFSDRKAIADYLWDQGWRREMRPEDVNDGDRSS